jgi:hypothetical protein
MARTSGLLESWKMIEALFLSSFYALAKGLGLTSHPITWSLKHQAVSYAGFESYDLRCRSRVM